MRAFRIFAPFLLYAGALTGVALGSSAGGATSPRRAVAHVSVSWTTCPGYKNFRCAKVPVPLVYGHPSEGTVDLAVVMLPSTSAHPKGDIFMNPGGPGGSGVQFLEQSPSSFVALRSQFNLLSWDPRGIGASTPAVTCDNPAQMRAYARLIPAPVTKGQLNQVVQETKSYVRECERNTPRLLLQNVGTRVTIEDLDTLRADLGQPKLNYIGFSYGTYLGELYAQKYPTHVRAMVLDGVINPALGLVGSSREQANGFEGDLHAFFSWCDANSSCHKLLPQGAKQAYDSLWSRFESGTTEKAYLKSQFGGTQKVTWGDAYIGVIQTLYSKSYWPYLGQAINETLKGDGSLLLALAFSYLGLQPNGTWSNEEAANVAINCVDSPSPRATSFYENLATTMQKTAPDFGAAIAWGGLVCAYWPFAAAGEPQAIHAPGTPKILVVGSTDDPATPYVWAKAVAHQLDNAELLTRNGSGHTAYFFSSCIRADVNNYFATTKVPRPNTVCPSN
ncbi:MAG: alpha/beta hydrolase [Acidimicrobiales bacterium]